MPGAYSMTHTADVYLVDRPGLLRALFPFGTTAEAMVATVRADRRRPARPGHARHGPTPSGRSRRAPTTGRRRAPTASDVPPSSRVEVVPARLGLGRRCEPGDPRPVPARTAALDDMAADVSRPAHDAARRPDRRPRRGRAGPAARDADVVVRRDRSTSRPRAGGGLAVTATAGPDLAGDRRRRRPRPRRTAPLGQPRRRSARRPCPTSAAPSSSSPPIRLRTSASTGPRRPTPSPRTSRSCWSSTRRSSGPRRRAARRSSWPVTCTIAGRRSRSSTSSRSSTRRHRHAGPPGHARRPDAGRRGSRVGIGGGPVERDSMPWVFVVDGNGIVRAKYQGVIGSDDVDVLLSMLAAGGGGSSAGG